MIKHFCDRCDRQVDSPKMQSEQTFTKGAFSLTVRVQEKETQHGQVYRTLCPDCICVIISGRDPAPAAPPAKPS